MQQPAIEVTDLTVAYHEKPVLWDVDLAVPSGVLMAVMSSPALTAPVMVNVATASSPVTATCRRC